MFKPLKMNAGQKKKMKRVAISIVEVSFSCRKNPINKSGIVINSPQMTTAINEIENNATMTN